MTSLGIFSCLIIVWQRWLLYKMLIISYVEICSKPMAILLYDDFLCVCVCFLPCLYWLVIVDSWRDIIFLWWFVCYVVCEKKKLRSLPNWQGRPKHGTLKDEPSGINWERWMEMRRRQEGWGVVGLMEKESRQGGLGMKVERGYSLENLHRSWACFSPDVLSGLKQA